MSAFTMLAGVNPADSANDVCVRPNRFLAAVPCAVRRLRCTAAVGVYSPVVFSCFASALGSHARFLFYGSQIRLWKLRASLCRPFGLRRWPTAWA